MSCRKPGVRISLPLSDGQHDVRFIGKLTVKNGAALCFGWRAEHVRDLDMYQYEDIPCGDCEGCRLRARREKTYRLCAEAEMHKDVWFVTLTYRDEDLTPAKRIEVDPSTGELVVIDKMQDLAGNDVPCATLVYDEFAAFEKRLRRRIEYAFGSEAAAFRQYHCGEYGSRTKRPHFHAIIFGLDERVLLAKQNKRLRIAGQPGLYRSFLLEECWGHGHVAYCKANFDTLQYVAGYTLKKLACWRQRSDAEVWYAAQGLDPVDYPRHLYRGKLVVSYPAELVAPEKGSGSNRPGIGRGYYEIHKDDMYRDMVDEMLIRHGDKVDRIKPCSYFDRLYDLENPTAMLAVKKKRKERADERIVVRIRETYSNAPPITDPAWRPFRINAERLLRRSDVERDATNLRRGLRAWKDI